MEDEYVVFESTEYMDKIGVNNIGICTELMNILNIKYGDTILVTNSLKLNKQILLHASTGDKKNLEDEGPNQYKGKFYVLLGEKHRKKLGLKIIDTRKTKKYSNIYNPVYIEQVPSNYSIPNKTNTAKRAIKKKFIGIE